MGEAKTKQHLGRKEADLQDYNKKLSVQKQQQAQVLKRESCL